MLKTSPLHIDEHLETDDDIAAFLQELASTGDCRDFISGLSTASKAKGMTEIAKRAGVTRASLYKSLADDARPRFETISKVVEALGYKLTIERIRPLPIA